MHREEHDIEVKVCDAIMGSGKAQPLDSFVLAEDGFIEMREVHTGTRVYGEDGRLHTVLGVYPQGEKDVYRITFSDRTTAECCGDHLWTFQLPQDKAKGIYRTESLRDIMRRPLFKQTNRGYKNWQIFIPIADPIRFRKREQAIDPYIMGVLLGDGYLHESAIFTNVEPDIIQRVRSRLGCRFDLRSRTDERGIVSHTIIDLERDGKNRHNEIIRELRKLGLTGCLSAEKFIPEEYLLSDISDRLELSRGLIDTDGHMNSDGCIEWGTVSEVMAKQAAFLFRSLGCVVAVSRKENAGYWNDGMFIKCRNYYRMHIKAPVNTKLYHSEKHSRRDGSHLLHTGLCKSIRTIEYIGKKECQCIYLDSEKHLYITDGFTVTHNTQASITYMNERPDRKFIYITPRLNEARRIFFSCTRQKFVEPSDQLKQYSKSKIRHTAALLEEGANIATTHQAFMSYTDEMLENISSKKYTLIIDEDVDVLELLSVSADDISLALQAGWLHDDDGVITRTDIPCGSNIFKPLLSYIERKRKIGFCEYDDGTSMGTLFYWMIPYELFSAFDEVIILTYLFQGQCLYNFLKMYDIPYTEIGVARCLEETGYRFIEGGCYRPAYLDTLKDKIHIYSGHLNDVGDGYYDLSMNWFSSKPDEVKQLKNNTYNYFNNIHRSHPGSKKLWATYLTHREAIAGNGYKKGFLQFNTKSTNDYIERDVLAYLVNIFPNVDEQCFYQAKGCDFNRDLYALSTMIQWIWRSAIRVGNDIDLYLPSKRMRDILTSWIDHIDKGGGDRVVA